MMNIFLLACGYSKAATIESSRADREHLSRFGLLVFFVSIWTGANWATASTIFTVDCDTTLKVLFATLAGIVGFVLVLVIDSTGIYIHDSQDNKWMVLAWFLFRIILILSIGTFTSERLFPYFLRAELEQQSLIERDASDAHRDATLQARFHTQEIEQNLGNVQVEATKLEGDIEKVPPGVRADLDRAQACRRDVQERQARMLLAGDSAVNVRIALGTSYLRCRDIDQHARSDLAEYRRDISTRLNIARQQSTDLLGIQAKVNNRILERQTEAHSIEAHSITPDSTLVLWQLISHNPFALIKAAVVMIVMLTIETLPFTAKCFVGRTETGAKLAAERVAGIRNARADLACRSNESGVKEAASAAVADAMTNALSSAEVQGFMQQIAARHAMASAPMQMAIQTLQTAERQKREFDNIVSRTPEHAAFAYNLWMEAVREAAYATTGEAH